MSDPKDSAPAPVHITRLFQRFSRSQRWEHLVLWLSFTVLLLTGLPQKYRATEWSQYILSTPQSVKTIQFIHHVAAVVLILEILYHLANALVLMFRHKLSADIFPNQKDFRDAVQMVKYLLFIGKEKPKFGKYNFEQKVTYWFIFFGVGILVLTGLILWFPIQVTRLLPGSVVPAALMAHGTEAIVALIFITIWHFYHVHIERLNLSIFTGKMHEEEMQEFHQLEFRRLFSQEKKEKEGKS